MTLSLNPIYNLKAVLVETGIKPDVLRAWERRYGLPMPQRTAGGHRLYSEHDIEIIKWLLSRQKDGLSISRAVEMWKENLTKGHDPLADIEQGNGKPGFSTRQDDKSLQVLPSIGIDELRSFWLSACLDFNEYAAEQALTQAFGLYPVELVCIELLQRGISEMGSLWFENRASIQQEHFATALAMRRLDALLSAAPVPNRLKTIMVGCPSNEWHTFIPTLMALFIRRRGYNVIYLGANVPSAHFIEAVEHSRADLVVLAAQQLDTAASLRELAAKIDASGNLVAFGGRIFVRHPDMVRHIPGHYLGGQLNEGIDKIEEILKTRPAPVQAIPTSLEFLKAQKIFIANRSMIESLLNQFFGVKMQETNYYTDANKYLGDNIISALSLGSMAYLDGEIEWLKALLQGLKLPESLLFSYLGAYAEALNLHLAGQIQPITEWFEGYLRIYSTNSAKK